jgi:hypothetical protein
MSDAHLPVPELMMLALALSAAAFRWWNRAALRERRPLAATLFEEPPPPEPELPRPAELPPAELLLRWCPGFSEPLLHELATALSRAARQAPERVGPAVLEGAADALAAERSGGDQTPESLTGPSRLVSASADEVWTVAEVERWALTRACPPLLLHERLRLRRANAAPPRPLDEALARLERARSGEEPLVDAAELGGWQLAAILESERREPTPALLRRLAPSLPAEASEPREERLALLPPDAPALLTGRVRDLAPRSLAARLPGAELGPLEQQLSGPMRELHRFWQALAGPEARVAEPGAVRLVDASEDARYCLARLELDLGAGPTAHREGWTLGQRLQDPQGPWIVLDIIGAPAPGHPH